MRSGTKPGFFDLISRRNCNGDAAAKRPLGAAPRPLVDDAGLRRWDEAPRAATRAPRGGLRPLAVVLGWTLIAVVDFLLGRNALPEGDLGWAIYEAVTLGAGGLAMSLALAAIHRRWLPARGLAVAPLVVGASIAGAAAWYALTDGVDWLAGYPFSEPLAQGLFGRGMFDLILLLGWHGVFLADRAARRAAEAERLEAEARGLALRYQLEPHFLVNVLNSAVALVDEDPARAQAFLTHLAALVRRTLEDDAGSETSLGRELEVVDRYLEIQRIRFEDKLRVAVDVGEGARRCAVPPLLLQSLVENAVKHGLCTADPPLEIGLSASYDGAALRLEIRNSGRLAPNGAGIGLANVVARLRALYPGRHDFEVVEQDGAVRATVEIRGPRVLA